MSEAEPKTPEIEKFSGAAEQFVPFMAQIRRQFWAKSDAFSTDKKKIAFISAHFTGHAATWFDDILESEAKLPVTSTEPKLLES
ncbi:hypothetical protein AX774_g7782, partial [Zancudomyces culisetae]